MPVRFYFTNIPLNSKADSHVPNPNKQWFYSEPLFVYKHYLYYKCF